MTVSAPPRPRVLVADDQPDVLEALRLLLSQHDFSLHLVASPQAVLDPAQSRAVGRLAHGLELLTRHDLRGLALVAQARTFDKTLPIVVMTGWGNIELAVDAMRAGAPSFVQKPWENAALVQILQREVADGRIARRQSDQHERDQRDGLLIQRTLMPARCPKSSAFRSSARGSQPAGGFGGDCYDVFTFGPDTLGLSIADVAGKAWPAALLMASLQAAVRAFAVESSAPPAICTSVNRLLCGRMVAGRFATFCYMRLDAARRMVVYANAGHNPPLLVRPSGQVERLESGGTLLGVFPDAEYTGGEVALSGGDRFLRYTDGITEARGVNEEEFGDERLTASLIRNRHLDAAALHGAVLAEVTAFAVGGFQAVGLR